MTYKIYMALIIGFLAITSAHAENNCADTVKQWNDALLHKDIDTAQALTSNTSWSYLEKTFGGITELANKYGSAMIPCEYKVPKVSGDRAIVEYVCTYPDGKKKLWRDTCFKEAGQWKAAPQHVQYTILE